MGSLPGGIEQGSLDVLRFEECVVAQDFLMRGTSGKEFEQIHHSKTGAADARASATFAGFYGNASEWVRFGKPARNPILGGPRFQTPHADGDALTSP